MMKKIYTLIVVVIAMVIAMPATAQNNIIMGGRDTSKVIKHPRSPFLINRVDREINKNVFAHKGEWICGIAASWGTLSANNADIALLLDNLKLGGSIVSVKPYFGAFYRNNHSIGLRLGYSYANGHFDNASLNLSDFIQDIEFSTNGIQLAYLSNAYSFSIFHRSYVPIDRRGRFGVFGEIELEGSYAASRFNFLYQETMYGYNANTYKVRLLFNPGIAAYIFPNICATVSFGLGGLQYNHIKQFDLENNPIGTRNYSKLNFKLNITQINIGITVHLWSKKNELKLRKMYD